MSDTPNIDIRPDHWQIVRDILRKHVPQYEVWAFGSRAKWLAKQYSDLDLAIITDQPLSLSISAALADEFSESDLPWKVDIVDWATTGESFRKIIERDKVVVHEPEYRLVSKQNGWSETSLGDLGEVNRGRSRHRPRNAQHLYGDEYPFIQTGDIKAANGRIINHTQNYSKAGLLQSRLWPTGTLVITIAANIAETAVLTYPACFPDSVVGFIADRKKSDVFFVEYLFRSLRQKIQSEHVGTGSVQDNINLQTLERLALIVPPVEEQRAISKILCMLDDRIELNRRMNNTLEAMARALFKSWFVDFDGMPPEGMQESDLGLIPQGWRVGRLDELLILQRGFDLPAQIRVAGKFPVVAAGGINGMHHKAMVKGPGIITGRSGVLGNVFFELSDFWPLNTTLWVKEFRVAKPCYAYELLRGLDFKKFNSGSAVPTLNRNHVHQLPQIIPPSEVIKKFEEEAMSLRKRIVSSERESRTLARLRDTLLPKLLSGELRVKDAERMAETI
ncbi:restriction endonuclease subunit S [Xanthomonas arboricola]|uniref:restriction endonuclease subunit S n=1 Tax=Xanthomonas arboricola TaxID=56448 RepID=UPI00169A31B8|nr:restriction endonuclease subunit S [Xanthomonas arboricola]NJB77818.1 type I restriction enzyme S subunit [Xanthomonas arboricola]